jgi:hypothetical protein
MAHEVLIDGVRYVPAVHATPTVETLLRALAEQWWGADMADSEFQESLTYLRITVTDNADDNGDTLEAFAARLAGILGGA